jgi:hypothetical protein
MTRFFSCRREARKKRTGRRAEGELGSLLSSSPLGLHRLPLPSKHHEGRSRTYLIHGHRAGVCDDVSNLSTELLHGLLCLGRNLLHLNELLVKLELLGDEIVRALLSLDMSV